jgi:hypothetical protein
MDQSTGGRPGANSWARMRALFRAKTSVMPVRAYHRRVLQSPCSVMDQLFTYHKAGGCAMVRLTDFSTREFGTNSPLGTFVSSIGRALACAKDTP